MRRALLASSAVAAILIACGSRGPLDDGPVFANNDAGEAGASSSSGAVDATSPVIVDAGHDAGPIACAGCVVGTCGQTIIECLGQPACLGVFTCITSTCLAVGGDGGGGGGGGINTGCLLGCATKNPAGALQVIQIFSCVTGTCGGDCGALLGGLGGGLGGLGGLLGGGGGGQKIDELETTPIDRATFDLAFSPWPELMSR